MDGWRDGWISRQIPFIFGFRGFQGHLSPRTSNFRDRALSASGEDATLRECSKRPRSDILVGFDREKRQRRGRRRRRKKEGEEVKGGQAPEQGNKGTTVASQSRSERVIASQGCSGREFFYFFR